MSPQIVLRCGRSNLLTLGVAGEARVYYGFWRLPESVLERVKRELAEVLGGSERVLVQREPNLSPLLLQYDPALDKFKRWFDRLVDTVRSSAEADSEGDVVKIGVAEAR